jgi:hypothetical protein
MDRGGAAARPAAPRFLPRIAAAQFMAMLRGELYIKIALGLLAEPSEEAIDAEVAAATDTLLRAFAAPEAWSP